MNDDVNTEPHVTELSCLEICAGAGGQALGLEEAGFFHNLAVEIDADACETLRVNRPSWTVTQSDVRDVSGRTFRGIDLLAGGVPCPPFSVAGHQLGSNDERDLFPEALRLVRESKPGAVMLENVRGLAADRFADYRESIVNELSALGYTTDWRLLQAGDFGVPQLRPRFILIALKPRAFRRFEWPIGDVPAPTVGETLKDLMANDGWVGADVWATRANRIAPTLVGGSRKHGGPDLGPTRARNDWLKLSVDGRGIADSAPTAADPIDHLPRLTLRMAARLQGFPDSWSFAGRKTSTYRQIGNAFPPPVAAAVGSALRDALVGTARTRTTKSKGGTAP